MSLFIGNLPVECTHKDLRDFLREPFKQLQIFTFNAFKHKSNKSATAILLEAEDVQKVINKHGGITQSRNIHPTKVPLIFKGRILNIKRADRQPDLLSIQELRYQEKARIRALEKAAASGPGKKEDGPRSFDIADFRCGTWGDVDGKPTFLSQYQHPPAGLFEDDGQTKGLLVFGRSAFAMILGHVLPITQDQWDARMDVPYQSVVNVVAGTCGKDYTLTITLREAPKTSKPEVAKPSSGGFDFAGDIDFADLVAQLSNLDVRTNDRPQRVRVCGVDKEHGSVAGSCLVYQVVLRRGLDLRSVLRLLNGNPSLPSAMMLDTALHHANDFKAKLRALQKILADITSEGGALPFRLKFQIEKLARNGELPPSTVQSLIPGIASIYLESGLNATAEAVRRLGRSLPVRNPAIDADEYSVKTLLDTLEENARFFKEDGSMYDIKRKHDHIALIHRVRVTPVGIYLEGPSPETKNRVLRKYEANIDSFIRVVFEDEDGEPMRFSGNASPTEIFRGRFQAVIDDRIVIAGHGYTFLGFSHSSLRSQTVWFMGPFVQAGSLIHATEVIKQLGDFSKIRCPAKCAARIGQTFSDTTATLTISNENLEGQLDVERNGRTFSDGCGTISLDLLQRIWQASPKRGLRPTLLQIRFAGAKGMLSLDTRLSGEKLILRPSMVKFEGTNSWDIELCGANPRPLPFFLNRQVIKVLEDLGIPRDVFLEMQAQEVERLRMMTLHPVNASNYLDANRMCSGQRLPSLLKLLHYIGLSFQADTFLRDSVEMVALVQLRDIKHRARIPVENGVTLYGVMDETGALNEGEIYCVTETVEGGRQVLQNGKVAITRSPVMHPGDIQIVQAVDVDPSSPLNSLSNCVVFSSKGERDLPSQLAGGDLDGDIFNVIYDPRLVPQRACEPADYVGPKPVNLDRDVETADMTRFFIDFLESDSLGRISNIHVQLSDRYAEGTFHHDCIELARLASVAVDFSKTGIPVKPTQFPDYKNKSSRPDFMCPAPRLAMTSYGPQLSEEEGDQVDSTEQQLVRDLDPVFIYRYSESNKALGHLYRAIDEAKFFAEMQAKGKEAAVIELAPSEAFMDKVWDYVKRQAMGIQYENYLDEARDIRSAYDHNVSETIEDFTIFPSHPLTEKEVFSGTIIGKSTGAQSKKIRELAREMNARYQRDVEYTREQIRRGEDDDSEECLPRAMACLEVALERPRGNTHSKWHIESFKYVAAEVCLREIMNLHGGILSHV